MSAPISLLDGPVEEAADYLAKLAVASRRAGGFVKQSNGFMESLQGMGNQAMGAMKGIGDQASQAWQGLDPSARHALMGAGLGGAAGLGVGMMGKRKNSPWTTALTGALGGGALAGGLSLASRGSGGFGASAEEGNKAIESAQNFSTLSEPHRIPEAIGGALGINGPSSVPVPTQMGYAGAVTAPALGAMAGTGASIGMSHVGGRYNPMIAGNAGANLRDYVNKAVQPGEGGKPGLTGRQAVEKFLFPDAGGSPGGMPMGRGPELQNAARQIDVDSVYNKLSPKVPFMQDAQLGHAALGVAQDKGVRSGLTAQRPVGKFRQGLGYGRHALGGMLGGYLADEAWNQWGPKGVQLPPGAN